MNMKQCTRGHYYDTDLHMQCPYCSGNTGSVIDSVTGAIGYTMPINPGQVSGGAGGDKTVAFSESASTASNNDGRTMAFIQKSIGIDPVVGWLVCIEGKDKGRDFRLHSDNNFLGRASNMDICIHGDDAISRENHAIVTFDSRNNQYFISPGSGRNIIRLNNNALFATTEIYPFDVIEVGTTKLMFVSFCGEKFSWEDNENNSFEK